MFERLILFFSISFVAASAACGGDDDEAERFSDRNLEAPSPADVAACSEAAAAYAALCTNDGARTCQVAAYANYCAGAVAPRAGAAALDCLRNESESDSCRTFADPSGAADCVASAVGPAALAGFDRLVDAFLAVCPDGAFSSPARFEPPLVLLSPAQLDATSDCLTGSDNCDAAFACLADGPQAALDACFD